MVRLLFEQSGTFKNEFIKLGYDAEDYDILNDFGQTNHVVDLFNEINKAYGNKASIFDGFDEDDLIMAFFPCTRFEVQIIMAFNGTQYQLKNKTDIEKLEYDLQLQEELSYLYSLVSKLAIVCLKRGLKLIIENPYNTQHYLTRYWSLKPKVIDYDRRERGDYYKKPTQYWFINLEPKHNIVFKEQVYRIHKSINDTHDKVERSLISPEYAKNFIQEFIMEGDEIESREKIYTLFDYLEEVK